MKQPLFVYEGKSYPVLHVSFFESGEIAHICFREKGKEDVTTVFRKYEWESDGRDINGTFRANLDECLQQQK